MFIVNPAINPKVGDFSTLPLGPLSTSAILQLFLTNFIRLGFVIGAVVFFFMLITGAVEYITAGGDKERTTSSTKRLTNAIIGLAILLSLFVILRLVKTIFGIDILQLEIPVIE
ncbi:MAG: hypothetical protein UX80_C0019G0007 [Candidatus Amesbacteria bacterium GW2011_GWA2_47_11b]|uniref:Uncharacterized protein n=3 Tax=Candidatus Amesiibacteriota TaxID=1752730 RepID=A0A0G1UT19_9BACT|nr:MAG: hypothetical protein UX42_C0003G0075 [Microgenomates group bacterium GW2011_GWC1_46_20]KKU57315.1 MAG: hypothetical protein UX80_C0019G0007 [Candidatus Amesbacteria bacterium GW2011_GWA2_47_11b]KKU69158.1 MAG: hypothetical protein UX92_C0014G0049 [Candidatus Amesbacteria bacterium GW2011_GWA1_47_20]KKU83425.1 MAG: hypothetical protein UY11_C0020G0007 [Candidatus Amesbacteria bacterium GW2011_GWC2_47_8]